MIGPARAAGAKERSKISSGFMLFLIAVRLEV
jgi:hypothetical protein